MAIFKKGTNKVETKLAFQYLEQMRQDLIQLGEVPYNANIYDYAVKFFNIIVSNQDNINWNLPAFNENEAMGVVKRHMANAGRQEYGWVRAKRDEPVTLDNLFLGNVAGIWTFPARKFKEDCKGDKYVQDNIQNQLYSFVSSHRKPLIDALKRAIDKENAPKPRKFLGMTFGKTRSR